ncbi:MAG: glutamate--cysteine ligase, partial [Candidatus Hydrogenedentes bacterium]|nr:glutamate--cysteine ligase [Candidatus Hydrogenedentota bacterium]
DMRATGLLDNRMDVYRSNCKRIPSVTGLVIPEPVFSPEEYQEVILQQMYREIAPFEPDAILQDEWLNARGAIARFDRNTIEVRVLDVQECPAADLAIVHAITGVLRGLCEEQWVSQEAQRAFDTQTLHEILMRVVRDGENAQVGLQEYAALFGMDAGATAGSLWRKLVEESACFRTNLAPEVSSALDTLLAHGTLAGRIIRSLNHECSRPSIARVYLELCDCLSEGKMYGA